MSIDFEGMVLHIGFEFLPFSVRTQRPTDPATQRMSGKEGDYVPKDKAERIEQQYETETHERGGHDKQGTKNEVKPHSVRNAQTQ